MKTILITGSSSGIGKTTAKYFAAKGWQVAATMRNPDNEKELQNISGIKIFKLDVLSESSIVAAIQEILLSFGTIDVVLNNAGYAVAGAFETVSPEQVMHQFNVNVFGLMNVVRNILPHFREHNNGTIINVSSVAGFAAIPGYSLYSASKFTVEGFSESLSFELRPFNIKVKIIEPGPIKTDFFGRSMDISKKEGLNVYNEYMQKILTGMDKMGDSGKNPIEVAETIYKAATSNSFKLRYPVGLYAKSSIIGRKLSPDAIYRFVISKMMQ